MAGHAEEVIDDDFWWLDSEAEQSRFITVGHHLPLSDDDNPRAIQWFHSADKDRLSDASVRYRSA